MNRSRFLGGPIHDCMNKKQNNAGIMRAALAATLCLATPAFAQTGARTEDYTDFNPGKSEKGKGWKSV